MHFSDTFFIDTMDFSSPAHDVFGRFESQKAAIPSFFSPPTTTTPLPRQASSAKPLLATTLNPASINPQASSRLYNNYFPQELRDLIFEYAAMPQQSSKPESPNPKVSTALLLTCRRTYLETFHLPPLLTSHTFTHPSPTPSSSIITPVTSQTQSGSESGTPNFPEEKYFSTFAPQQLAMVKSLTLKTHQSFLSHPTQGLAKLLTQDYLKRIENLRIEIDYCDWEGWQRYLGLELHAWDNEEDNEDQEEENTDEEGDTEMLSSSSSLPQTGWGTSFSALPSLHTLTISLTTTHDRSSALSSIVTKATRWTFPLSPKSVLSTKAPGLEGLVVGKEIFDGPENAWADFCPACCGRSEDWDACRERRIRRREGRGPVLERRVLKWGAAIEG